MAKYGCPALLVESLRCSRDEGSYFSDIDRRGAPDDVEVYREVVVDDLVAETGTPPNRCVPRAP